MPQDKLERVLLKRGRDVNLPLEGSNVEALKKRLSITDADHPEDLTGPDGIRVPRHPRWRRDSIVVGTDTAKDYERLANMVPEIRGRAKMISPGYTRNLIEALAFQAGNDRDSMARSDAEALLAGKGSPSVLGVADPVTSELYVQRTGDPKEDINTMAHEFQHLMGFQGQGMKGFSNPMASEMAAGVTGDLAGDTFYPPNEAELKAREAKSKAFIAELRKRMGNK